MEPPHEPPKPPSEPSGDPATAQLPPKKRKQQQAVASESIAKYLTKRAPDARPLAEELAKTHKRGLKRKKHRKRNPFIDDEAQRGREEQDDGDDDPATPEVSEDEHEASDVSVYDDEPVLALDEEDREALEETRRAEIQRMIAFISRDQHEKETVQRVADIIEAQLNREGSPYHDFPSSPARVLEQFLADDFERQVFVLEDERVQRDRLYANFREEEVKQKEKIGERSYYTGRPWTYARLVQPRALRHGQREHKLEDVPCELWEWLDKRKAERERAWSIIEKSKRLDEKWQEEERDYAARSLKLESRASIVREWERRIFAPDTDIPWARKDCIFGFDRTVPADLKKQPLATARPGDFSMQMKAALKKTLANHIFDVMQLWSGFSVMYTIEWKRDPRDVDRLDDWRMSLARRHALKRLVDQYARQLGIFAVVEGIETHGGTRERGGKNKVVKEKKYRGVEAKKRGQNPRGGGKVTIEEDEDAAELELQERKEADEDELQRKRDETVKEQRTLEMIKAAQERMNKIDSRELEKIEAKIAAKKQAVKDWDKTAADTLHFYVGIIRERMDELIPIVGKTALQQAALAGLRDAYKKLKAALPNARVGLSHEHMSVFVAGNTAAPHDPFFLARQISAPMVRRCTLVTSAPAESWCLRCEKTYAHPTEWERCPACDAQEQLPECEACQLGREHERCPRATDYSARDRRNPNFVKWITLRPRYRCKFCPRTYELDYAAEPYDEEKHPSISELDPLAYDFSLQHRGGLGAEDCKADTTYNRTTDNFSNLFLYPLKSARCKVTRGWLEAAGRSCARLSTLWFYEEENADNQAGVFMFKNLVFQVLQILNGGKQSSLVSLSPQSDHWTYVRLKDIPVVQKKKDKHFFLERVKRHMVDEGLYIIHGTEAICQRTPGLRHSLRSRFERIAVSKRAIDATDVHTTLLGWLSQDKDWVVDAFEMAHHFRDAPEIKMFLPRASRCYEIFELRDAYFCMFRSPDEWPEWIPREHEWEARGNGTAVYKVLYKNRDNTEELVSRLLARSAAPGTICFCAHGFPDLAYADFNALPVHWLAAIGKYAREPHTMPGPPQQIPPKYVMNAAGAWVLAPGTGVTLPTTQRTSHFGHKGFVACLDVLRTLLFRPHGDRQRWPFFYGPSSSGKTSWVARWIKMYYYAEDRVAATGNFAGGDMSESKRIVLLEEFKAEKMTRSAFVQLLDCGQQVVEPKGQPARNVINNAVKCLDGNWLPEYKDDSDAINQRLYPYHCGLLHQGSRSMREIGDLITKHWYLVPAFLARRDYLADNLIDQIEGCIKEIGTH